MSEAPDHVELLATLLRQYYGYEGNPTGAARWLVERGVTVGRVAAGAGDPKWVRFDSTGPSDSGKTETWRVVTRDGSGNLGRVAWFGRWRRYAFFPFDATVFEHQCLRDIAAFCERQTAAQRAAKVEA